MKIREGAGRESVLLYFLGLMVISLTLGMIFQGRLSRLDVPLTYGAKEPLSIIDGNLWRTDLELSSGQKFFNQVDLYPTMSGIKTFIENGSFSSSRLNFPVGFNSAAFPTPSSQSQFLLLKVISFFSSSPGVVANLYFLFSILLIYSVVFLLLKRVSGVSWFALIGSVTFALSPTTYGKEQLFSLLGHVPIIVTLVFIHEISKGRRFRVRESLAGGFICATFGMYGAIFSLLLITLTIFISLSGNARQETKAFAKLLCFNTSTICLAFYFSIRSSLHYWTTNLKAPVLNRGLAQIEVWPFRLIDSVVLPGYSHFVPTIFKRSNFVPSNRFGEGVYTFGPYGLVAITAAIYCLIKFSSNSENKSDGNSSELRLFSCLACLVCLVAPLGGLFPAISGMIDIPIKSWERIEVALSLIALIILSQILTNPNFVRKKPGMNQSRKVLIVTMVVLSVGVSFLSAQPLGIFNNEAAALSRWDRESAFFQDIERSYGEIRILQLPKMSFPEGPPILGSPPNSDFIAHFQTSRVNLSVGEVTDSTIFNTEYSLSGSFIELIERVRQLPYDGVIIDLRATSKVFNLELNKAGPDLCSNFKNKGKTNYVFCKLKQG